VGALYINPAILKILIPT